MQRGAALFERSRVLPFHAHLPAYSCSTPLSAVEMRIESCASLHAIAPKDMIEAEDKGPQCANARLQVQGDFSPTATS